MQFIPLSVVLFSGADLWGFLITLLSLGIFEIKVVNISSFNFYEYHSNEIYMLKEDLPLAITLSVLGYTWKLLFHSQRVFSEHFHSCAISNYPSQAIRIAGLRYCVYSCLHQVGPAIKQATDWEGIAHRRNFS